MNGAAGLGLRCGRAAYLGSFCTNRTYLAAVIGDCAHFETVD
jgi:hypothetical protein